MLTRQRAQILPLLTLARLQLRLMCRQLVLFSTLNSQLLLEPRSIVAESCTSFLDVFECGCSSTKQHTADRISDSDFPVYVSVHDVSLRAAMLSQSCYS